MVVPITWVDPQVSLLRQILATLTRIESELHEQNEMIRRGGDTVASIDEMLDVVKEYDDISSTMPSLGDGA